VRTAARHRHDVIASEEFPVAQVGAMATAIHAAVSVASEKERIGDLAAELPGNVDEANEADHGGTGEVPFLRPERSALVHLEYFGLAVDDEAECPSDRQDRQGLERSIERQTPHGQAQSSLSRVRPSIQRWGPDVHTTVVAACWTRRLGRTESAGARPLQQ